MAGARGLLINITGGDDMTLFEVDQAANRIREEVAEDANIIFGSAVDDTLNGRIRVSVVATGIDTPVEHTAEPAATGPRLVAVGGGAPLPPRFEKPGHAGGQPAPHVAAGPAPRMPAGNQATALAYAQEEEPELIQQAAPMAAMQAPAPRSVVQPHPLFTPAPVEPAPQHRPSLFGKVTGAWRRGTTTPPAEPEMPDMRRAEPRFVPGQNEPAALVRPASSEQDVAGLDIPAFLRRQSS
jgi:cell division protein FtsZ